MLLIAVTGYGGQENQMQCQAAGFDHHMVKPVDLDTLKALIDSYVSTARATGQAIL
jgi:CheY-like chemotaxis protein